MTASMTVHINVEGHLEAGARVLGVAPVVNQEMNRGFKGIGGAFMRQFGQRIKMAGFKTRKVGKKGGSGRQPFVPGNVRAMGFGAKIRGFSSPHEKSLTMGTGGSNKFARAHEFGATIKPGKLMPIYERKGGKKTLVAMTREVHIKPRLGFRATWQAFQGEFKARIFKMWSRVAQRV